MTQRPTDRSNTRVLLSLLAVIVVMGAGAWAAVPFYNWFCKTTGYGGTTNTAEVLPDKVLDREILVRFDANVAPGMPWKFKPVQTEMKLKIGQNGLAFYEAYNPTDHVIAGTASYNVSPDVAGYYFDKIQCFCFTEQVLQPGERVQMPVSFFVDPGIVDDADAKRIHAITLSYTFYQTDLPEPEDTASVRQRETETVN
ncbi:MULTISPECIES: cytochrome c oxidase assembly protein [Thioclava]|uniref:Cytochrome c oxidase assembly protein CtaG n=1 Tax=Thioclava nitratireducens TaxID=1915078 RepID=A0ABM6IE10_9RHOB|nr:MULTISPECIES: cytochrome c oxidase assembly protein [Thioclava]AQS46990.1 cytochrome c oxidase assembly protein [Thioclava nitratireducens]OWY00944.1 cytochrome c oxidase assembly protein [Thioclava sp. IC9]OWY01150.1 cytochrome c oxidase assembly protein [Thioclava sp. F1Mire-8]OWY08628.1 cytochrome c oxidase assembly protein [Thioclava sp. F42-5]OWY11790.1 cytochrome c oxidase assembly protein [Thioclava sp. F34-6]